MEYLFGQIVSAVLAMSSASLLLICSLLAFGAEVGRGGVGEAGLICGSTAQQ